MMRFILLTGLLALIFMSCSETERADPYEPDHRPPAEIPGMKLVWNEEFNNDGKPDPSRWRHENGLVRNRELQFYQEDNASVTGGLLVIEGRREKIENPRYDPASEDWRAVEYAGYTSSSINTRGLHEWQFGRFEIRARIDTVMGYWPAIWTLGIDRRWPANGEIDIMELYRVNGVPTILANFAWLSADERTAEWVDRKIPLADFLAADPDWADKFHIWRMDWDEESVRLYLDDVLLNTVPVAETVNPDGFNPFLQPHYILLNLAIGSNGGDPSETVFPVKYEVDYVRVYQDE
jgi:beta-glucanase (GH16 family)